MTDLVLRSSEVPGNFAEQMHMATVLAESTLLPAHLRGRPANVLLILQGARALDVSAFWALQSMHVIEGKLGMSAELMRGLAVRAGHQVRVVERTEDRAVIEIKRKDRDTPYTAEFTWKDAIAAKLQDKDNWKKYRKSMLVARATSIAMRDECPDVLFGVVYTPDELGAVTDADERPVLDSDGKPYIEGETVQVTQANIEQMALELALADVVKLPGTWQKIVSLGVPFVKIGDRSDDSLWDVMIDRVCKLVEADDVTVDNLRDLWMWGTGHRVLDAKVKRGEAVVKVGDLILTRQQQLATPQESKPDHSVTEEPADPVTEEQAIAEVVKVFDVKPEDIDTEHARQMRQEAADSWEDHRDQH